VEGTVREVKRRVRVVASSYRAIDRSGHHNVSAMYKKTPTIYSTISQHVSLLCISQRFPSSRPTGLLVKFILPSSCGVFRSG